MVFFLLGGCNPDSTTSSGSSAPGTIGFDQSSISVTADSYREVTLSIQGSGNTPATVQIASSNTNAIVVTPTQCVISNAAGSHSSCEITVRGLSAGSTANITATAPGYTISPVSVTVVSTPIAGGLSFQYQNESVTVGSVRHVLVNLDGSSGVSDLEVSLIPTNKAIATVSPTTCVLSSGPKRSCSLTISGVALGSTTIAASALGYGTVTNLVSVISTPIEGNLFFDEGTTTVAVGASKYVAVSLADSSGVAPITVNISAANSDAATYPSSCTVSSTQNVCIVTVSGKSAGSDVITASASTYATPANLTALITESPVAGNLVFDMSAESVAVGSTTKVTLALVNSQKVTGLNVKLSTSNSNIKLSTTTCVLSTTDGVNTCPITITGLIAGSAVITATATGYAPAPTNSVTILPAGSVINGTLAFARSPVPVVKGDSSTVILSLVGSSGVTGVTTVITSGSPSVATVTSPCTLSTESNTCTVSITGVESGSSTISASRPSLLGSNTAKTVANVSSTANPGTLIFTPSSVIMAAAAGAYSESITLSLSPDAAGVKNLYVQLVPNPTSIVGFGAITQAGAIMPGYCCLSSNSESSSCSFGANSPSGLAGSGTIVATPVAGNPSCSSPTGWQNYNSATVEVNAVVPVTVSRTITAVNNCSYPVYFGISGGGFSNGESCPLGSTPESGQCWWNNPAPTNGYLLSANGGTTSVTIPANYYNVGSADTQWSGGAFGRLNCSESGACDIGSCTGQGHGAGGTTGLACATGSSYIPPNTAAEFTLLRNGNDAYDITLISGMSIPMSMTPSNNKYSSTGNPYTCGSAGSTVQQGTPNVSPFVLFGATWAPNPQAVTTSVATPPEVYNYVSGSALTNTSCTTGNTSSSPGTPSSSLCNAAGSTGPVCGLTYDSIYVPLKGGTGGTTGYQYSCGTRLSWMTGAQIWEANESITNIAPFAFNTVQSTGNPNSFNNGTFYQCATPPLGSGYPVAVPPIPVSNANACGGTNWGSPQFGGSGTQIATPTEAYEFTNPVWVSEVYPRITWIKEACPTCYSFQYDDVSSSFGCHTNATENNPANATNYTITYCPS